MKKLFFMFFLVSYFYSCSPTSPGEGGGPKDGEQYVPKVTVRSAETSFGDSFNENLEVFDIGKISLELDPEDINQSYISYFFIPDRKSNDINNLIQKMNLNIFKNGSSYGFAIIDDNRKLDLSKPEHTLDFTSRISPKLNKDLVLRTRDRLNQKMDWSNFSLENIDIETSNTVFNFLDMDDDYQIKVGDTIYLILVITIENKSKEIFQSVINKTHFKNIKYSVS